MSGPIVIGADHGYAAMKTAHFSFPTGLVGYEHEPYTSKDVLVYGGKYYVVGSGRQPLQKDKTVTEDYYLLTLAAIAKELEYRNAEQTASVHLAAGLPLTSFGRDKKKFRAYLHRDGRPVPFRYEGRDYTVTIAEVSLFPQGYAAVLTQPELLDEPSVIVADIGGWTVDLMRLDNRIPNAATCRSLELGMIRCLDEIAEQVRRLFGVSMTAVQIETVLRGDAVSTDERIRAVIHAQADKYIQNLLSAITESGLDARAMPAIFLGGGAALLRGPRRNPAKRLRWGKEEQRSERAFAIGGGEGYGACDDARHVGATDGLCRPLVLDDVSLNAKGYERLVGQVLRGTQPKPSEAGSAGRGGARERAWLSPKAEAKQSGLCDDDMAEKRRLNLSLNLSIPQQREAWRILRAIPSGRRTDTVCRMVLEHKRQTELLDTVRATIREELQKVDISTTEKAEQPRAGDVDDSVLGFLMSLQKEEGDTPDSLF